MSHRYAPVICAFALAGGFAFSGAGALAQGDNTRANAPGQSPSTTTADQQKNDAADVRITQSVRRAVTQDKSLSTYAHNVKIITAAGHVTLKGPVRTEQEKASIEAKAAQIAGADNVANEMTVVPVKPSKQ
jgi:hyperosmotically inducible protein